MNRRGDRATQPRRYGPTVTHTDRSWLLSCNERARHAARAAVPAVLAVRSATVPSRVVAASLDSTPLTVLTMCSEKIARYFYTHPAW